jgi:DNA replication protein DnaC
MYNIMIIGPSGVGKSMLAAGLCADAIEKGYKAYFRTMDGNHKYAKDQRLFKISDGGS